MTGFARGDGGLEGLTWAWEVRSVNGRGLDVRLRLPPGYEALEPRVREACTKRFLRGNLQVSLNLRRSAGAAEIRLNEMALAQVMKAVERGEEIVRGSARPSLEALLQIKGVLEIAEPDDSEEAQQRRVAAMTQSLEAVLGKLGEARAAEGARLGAVLSDQMQRIASLAKAAESSPAREPAAIAKRLSEQVGRLIQDGGAQLDEGRLYQEAALIAARADIEEELKRLASHVAAVGDLLVKGGPVGRQLDFLAQELNREANTLCSKSNDVELTRIGLALKLVIDQMREQVQNVE
jgi:uncharacterized protein (TIGR00255 family)